MSASSMTSIDISMEFGLCKVSQYQWRSGYYISRQYTSRNLTFSHDSLRLSILHLDELEVSAWMIFKPPISVYARWYLFGCQATTGHGPEVFTLWTYSPVSTCAISNPAPSSLPPTMYMPSKLKLMLLTGPTMSIKVRWHWYHFVSLVKLLELLTYGSWS